MTPASACTYTAGGWRRTKDCLPYYNGGGQHAPSTEDAGRTHAIFALAYCWRRQQRRQPVVCAAAAEAWRMPASPPSNSGERRRYVARQASYSCRSDAAYQPHIILTYLGQDIVSPVVGWLSTMPYILSWYGFRALLIFS